MLKIRKEQMDALQEAAQPRHQDDVVDFIVKHLHEESPELLEGIEPDYLREMVRNGVRRAGGHGLKSLGDVTAFVSIMFEIAPNFDEQPDLARVLADTAVPPEEKIDSLFAPELDAAWEEADRNYDPNAWFPELREEEEEE